MLTLARNPELRATMEREVRERMTRHDVSKQIALLQDVFLDVAQHVHPGKRA